MTGLHFIQILFTKLFDMCKCFLKSRFPREKHKWRDSLTVLHNMVIVELTVTRIAFYLKLAWHFSFVWGFLVVEDGGEN